MKKWDFGDVNNAESGPLKGVQKVENGIKRSRKKQAEMVTVAYG